MSRLTPKQKKFCEYYLETGNATQAAIRAGYSEKNADKIGPENLNKTVIKQYLEKRMTASDNKRIASANEVLEYLSRVVRGEEKDQFGLDVSIQDRTKAADLLLRRYKVFDKADKKTEQLKIQELELNIKKKEIEIEQLSNGGNPIDTKTESALDKLSKRVEADLNDR